MADNEDGTRGVIDFDKGLGLAAGAASSINSNGKRVSEVTRAASEKAAAIHQALQSAVGAVPNATLAKHIIDAGLTGDMAARYLSAFDAPAYTGVGKRMSDLLALTGADSRLGKAAEEIASQQRILDEMRAPTKALVDMNLPSIPVQKIPPSPLVETNKRLARIEERFEHISEVAESSTRVAVSLQASAAEFLQKFEAAAADTNKSGSKALMVGWLALAIAIVTGGAQIAAPLFIPDQEAEALRQSVVDLKGEIAAMRADEAASGQRLLDALAQGDAATAAAVREVLRENSPKAEVQK